MPCRDHESHVKKRVQRKTKHAKIENISSFKIHTHILKTKSETLLRDTTFYNKKHSDTNIYLKLRQKNLSEFQECF